MALVLAWGIAAVAFAALRLLGALVECPVTDSSSALPRSSRRPLRSTWRPGSGISSSCTETSLDRQSGNVLAAEVAETPTFSLGTRPDEARPALRRAVLSTRCARSPTSRTRLPATGSESCDLWRLPLAIQLPALVLLPLCVVGGRGARRVGGAPSSSASEHMRELRLLRRDDRRRRRARPRVHRQHADRARLICATASPATSCSPALLAGDRGRRARRMRCWLVLARVRARGGLLAEIRLRRRAVASALSSWWRRASYARVERAAAAREPPAGRGRATRRVARDAIAATDRGRRLRTPAGVGSRFREASTLTFGCGSDAPASFTLYVAATRRRRSRAVRPADPRLVAAWPTVMGSPPRQLRAPRPIGVRERLARRYAERGR